MCPSRGKPESQSHLGERFVFIPPSTEVSRVGRQGGWALLNSPFRVVNLRVCERVTERMGWSMNSYPSENRLKLAGWLSIASGVGPFPSNAILVFALFSENPALTAAATGVQVGLVIAAFFVHFAFIRLLTGPLRFHGATLILWLLIGVLVAQSLFTMPLRLPYLREIIGSKGFIWLLYSVSIVKPLLYAMLGVRLRSLWVKLPSTKFLSIASWAVAFVSILYLLTRWIPGLMSITTPLTFLAKGVFYIALALVFFEAARFAHSGWQTASTDNEVRPDGEI